MWLRIAPATGTTRRSVIRSLEGSELVLTRARTSSASASEAKPLPAAPATAVAWFGQKKGPEGNWVSAGCFKQGFFANEGNLRKWLEARPAMTGRQISIAQALADKMKLTPEQIAKACKLGECK